MAISSVKSQISDPQSTNSTTLSNATEGQDTNINSTTQTSRFDQSTVISDTKDATSTQQIDTNQPTVAADKSNASTTQSSASDRLTVTENTSDASVAQNADSNHSTESPTIDSGNDKAPTSAKINGSDTSKPNIPQEISDSTPATNGTANKDADAQNVHHTDKVEEPTGHVCKKVGRFPHPTSCTKFYYCWDNDSMAHEFTCAKHRAFDPVSQLCVVNYGVCAIAPKCNDDKQIIPNPEDKWTFFECKVDQFNPNEFELHCRYCANYREFDEKLGYCKLTSVNGEMELDSDEFVDSNVQCGETGLMIDYEDDTKYYECVVWSVSEGILKPIRHKCPIYHVFSMLDGKCVPLSMLSKLNTTNN